ncbi:MAG: hypothetical protein ABIC40_01665 [bacterium]
MGEPPSIFPRTRSSVLETPSVNSISIPRFKSSGFLRILSTTVSPDDAMRVSSVPADIALANVRIRTNPG